MMTCAFEESSSTRAWSSSEPLITWTPNVSSFWAFSDERTRAVMSSDCDCSNKRIRTEPPMYPVHIIYVWAIMSLCRSVKNSKANPTCSTSEKYGDTIIRHYQISCLRAWAVIDRSILRWPWIAACIYSAAWAHGLLAQVRQCYATDDYTSGWQRNWRLSWRWYGLNSYPVRCKRSAKRGRMKSAGDHNVSIPNEECRSVSKLLVSLEVWI